MEKERCLDDALQRIEQYKYQLSMLKNYSDEKTEMLSETLMVKLRYEEIIKKLLANESNGRPESIEDVI